MTESTLKQIMNKLSALNSKMVTQNVKLEDHSKILESHSKLLDHHSSEIFKLRRDVEEIKEKVAYIPRMYEILDGLASEIVESRQDRIIQNSRLSDHERRIVNLETERR